MKWLSDKPNLDKMTICIRERGRKDTDKQSYSLTFSKSFKDYIISNGKSFMRFGYDEVDGAMFLVLQLSDEEIGLSLLNDKNQVRLWIDVTEYVEQYLDNGIKILLDIDLRVELKKNGNLYVDLLQSKPA